NQLCRGAWAAGLARRRERYRSHGHCGESQSGPVDSGLAAPQRVCGWVGLPAPVPRPQVPVFGIARPEPGHRYAIGNRSRAARPGALLPTARRRRDLRSDPDVALGRCRRAQIRKSGRRNHPVRDQLPAPLSGFRGERPRLPLAGGPAELEHVVCVSVPPPQLVLSDGVLELQLVAILDGGGHARGARRQHERARPAEQPLVVHSGVTAGQLGTTFCDRDCTRGGPAVRADPYLSVFAEVDGDERPAFTPYVWMNYLRGDGGRTERFNGNIQIAFRVASQFRTSLTL